MGLRGWTVMSRAMLSLGIELATQKHREGREIEPHQQHHDGAKRAVSLVVTRERADIEGEERRAADPQDGGGECAPAAPAIAPS